MGEHGRDAPSAATMTAPKPKSIGPYQLLRPLGEGGMGPVWLAEQKAPVRWQVALKLIRFGRIRPRCLATRFAIDVGDQNGSEVRGKTHFWSVAHQQ